MAAVGALGLIGQRRKPLRPNTLTEPVESSKSRRSATTGRHCISPPRSDVRDVVSTTAAEDSVPEQFFDDFASVLAKHRAWDRETDSVPALIAMWPV